MTRRNARIAPRREARAAIGVFILLLNIFTGFLSHVHYAAEAGLAFPRNGGRMVICSGTRMVFIGKDGKPVPEEEGQERGHRCACCMLMKASAVMPPPPHTPKPLHLAAIQILRPSGARHFDAVAVPARRNRDPPFQVLA